MRTPLLALVPALLMASGVAAQDTMAPPPPPPGAPMPPPPPHHGMRWGGGGGPMGLLMSADANHDGVVTREELIAAADARFDQLDANHDGVLTADEMRAGMPMRRGREEAGGPPPPQPPVIQPVPITRQQYRDHALRPFDRIDANHDGKVDRTEMQAFMAKMRERRMERREGGGMTPPPPPPPAGQPQ